MKKNQLLIVLASLLFMSCSVEDTEINDKTQINSELSTVSKTVTINFKDTTTEIDKNILKEDLNVVKTIQINTQKEIWVVQTNYTNEFLKDVILFNNSIEQVAIENENDFLAREGENTGGGDKGNETEESEEEKIDNTDIKDNEINESEEEVDNELISN